MSTTREHSEARLLVPSTTLATLMLTDGYIALVAYGAFSDPRILN